MRSEFRPVSLLDLGGATTSTAWFSLPRC